MREAGWYWVKWWSNFSEWKPAYFNGIVFEMNAVNATPTVIGPKIEEPEG